MPLELILLFTNFSDLFQIDAKGFGTESPLTSDPRGSGELQLMSMCYARKIFSCCTIVQALLMYICKLVVCIVMLLVVR